MSAAPLYTLQRLRNSQRIWEWVCTSSYNDKKSSIFVDVKKTRKNIKKQRRNKRESALTSTITTPRVNEIKIRTRIEGRLRLSLRRPSFHATPSSSVLKSPFAPFSAFDPFLMTPNLFSFWNEPFWSRFPVTFYDSLKRLSVAMFTGLNNDAFLFVCLFVF